MFYRESNVVMVLAVSLLVVQIILANSVSGIVTFYFDWQSLVFLVVWRIASRKARTHNYTTRHTITQHNIT